MKPNVAFSLLIYVGCVFDVFVLFSWVEICLIAISVLCLFRRCLTRELISHKSIFHEALKDGIIAILIVY